MKLLFLLPCFFFALHAFGQTNSTPAHDSVYTHVEQMPEPGFDLTSFISKNLRFSDSVKEDVGTVLVKFIVNEDGSLSDLKVVKGKEIQTELEALINKMPKWKPGKHNGVPVKVWFSMPIILEFE
jgi:protein TonB